MKVTKVVLPLVVLYLEESEEVVVVVLHTVEEMEAELDMLCP